MIIIKRILVVLILIISIVLIAAYFMPKEYAVEREITINKPTDTVFNYVKSLKIKMSLAFGPIWIRK